MIFPSLKDKTKEVFLYRKEHKILEGKRAYRTFDKDFKANAVILVREG